MRSLAARFLLMVVALVLAAGCAGRVSVDSTKMVEPDISVNTPPAPGVMAAAIQYVTGTYPVSETMGSSRIGIRLPEGAADRAYNKSLKAAGPGFERASKIPARPCYEVIAVNVFGHYARADILAPPLPDGRNLIEVRLRGRFGGWEITGDARFDPIVLGQEFLDRRKPQPVVMMESRGGGNGGAKGGVPTSLDGIRLVPKLAEDGQLILVPEGEEGQESGQGGSPRILMGDAAGQADQPMYFTIKQLDDGQLVLVPVVDGESDEAEEWKPILIQRSGERALVPVRPVKDDAPEEEKDKGADNEPIK